MLEGELNVDVGDKRIRLRPSDDELEIPARCRNWAIPLPPSEDRKYTKFLLNDPGADGPYMLDAIFYENYYRYMDQALSPGGEGISVVQVFCMFGAGGSCLVLLNFILFSMTLSKAMTVVIGRWLGGILGYQPYYKEWTTDWETVEKRFARG
ncbi:hypothetical protein K458DRAFT_372838 [Lentithecium fluviatile CBS 122367]|uniref:Uncharacterized protein n=1 Tax=Lentithecium fluviatile CBS 122367 TaxID=1168545 RepID=A0A6G1IS57_9PLEO|nr:hypothetical protein K458DRAFT_372838 [Lentithecium fluviatile CBS 122367]